MALSAGTRLGPYEITASLGAGGMGEVYRAHDTKLKRDVAIKVLPETFAADPDRLARFQREAQVLASLNHPHIGGIYGLEESDGVRALVLELVEGDTLADRIAHGPIPLDDALPIARQIADALEAAHEHGVIHRDLKPANIKITPDGVVKVLDFGLAKLAAPESAVAGVALLSQSPTITSPATMTGVGVLLGTAAYMSPEQAKGRPADKRSDVWAFGCVLYEMLAGTRAFSGEDVSDTLAAVLRGEPDWRALPADLLPAIRTLLKRSLERDRRKRAGDIAVALILLDEATNLTASGPQDPAYVQTQVDAAVSATRLEMTRSARRRLRFVGAVALLGIAVVGSAVWVFTRPAPPRVTRMTITTPAAAALRIDGFDRDLALTPDGTRIVYVGANGRQLFVRPLDALEPTVLVSTAGEAQGVFTSPDGQWVGYVENNTTLKKVAITGGPPVTLLTLDGNSRGLTWAADDTVVFATSQAAIGLQRVPAGGGSATVLTRPDPARGEADHLWPEVLPGGRSVLFTIMAASGGLDAAQVAVLDLDTGSYKTLVRGGSHAHHVATGHLVYAAAGTLHAVAFDVNRLEARGTPVPVLPRLATTAVGAADFSVAADGTLVYVDAPGSGTSERTLVWADRQGRETPLAAPPREYLYPRLSPDGTRVALFVNDQEQDLWIWDLARATLTRLTFNPGSDQFLVWTPDGRRLVFTSEPARTPPFEPLRPSDVGLYLQAADGTGAVQRLTESSNFQSATGIAPDGTGVVFDEVTPTMGRDLVLLTLGPERRVSPLLQTRFQERNGIVSPDGRWLAYDSNSSGRYEVYVRPFPNVGDGQWQVSTGGGWAPLWARSGRELFYVAPPDGALMAVPVESRGASWNAGNPTKLLEGRYTTANVGLSGRMYDVSPDGQRFLMINVGGDQSAAPPQIVVVQNCHLGPAARETS